MYFISPKNVERKLENNEKIRNLMGGVTKLCFTTGIKKILLLLSSLPLHRHSEAEYYPASTYVNIQVFW